MRTRLVVLCLLTVLIAGCVGINPSPEGQSQDIGGNESNPGKHPQPTNRPHVHDRWNGQTKVTVIDRAVSTGTLADLDPRQSVWENAYCVLACPSVIEFAPKEGNIVPPGTENVTFTASWNASAPPRNEILVSASYMSANTTSFEVFASDIDSGSAHQIRTTVPMADGGHAKQSLWRFRLTVAQCSQDAGCFTGRTEVEPFEVEVTVTAHRTNGTLPKEPPHPDWWADGPARTVATVQGRANRAGAGAYSMNLSDPASQRSVSTSYAYLPGETVNPVPPGTRLLAARVNWTNDAPSSAAAGAEPWLSYRNNGGQTFFRSWEPDRVGTGTAVFVEPFQGNETDGMYVQNRSRWSFLFGFEGEQETGLDDPLLPGRSVTSPYRFDSDYTLEIRAFNATDLPEAWSGS